MKKLLAVSFDQGGMFGKPKMVISTTFKINEKFNEDYNNGYHYYFGLLSDYAVYMTLISYLREYHKEIKENFKGVASQVITFTEDVPEADKNLFLDAFTHHFSC